MPTLSFITANYVARALSYRGGDDWMKNDNATREAAGATQFQQLCEDIAAAGFEAIDIWTSHCHWQHAGAEDFVEIVKGICSAFDFTITSYAGGLDGASERSLEGVMKFAKQLGAPVFAGGMWGCDVTTRLAYMDALCQRLGLKWAFENHGEKSVDEIFTKIGRGAHKHIGVALDTGWCGTQGIDAVEAAQALRDKLLVVHLKDVKEAGKHETCALGEGIVPIERVVRYLRESDYQGPLCIEHEPFDRDPMPEVVASAKRVREWMKA